MKRFNLTIQLAAENTNRHNKLSKMAQHEFQKNILLPSLLSQSIICKEESQSISPSEMSMNKQDLTYKLTEDEKLCDLKF